MWKTLDFSLRAPPIRDGFTFYVFWQAQSPAKADLGFSLCFDKDYAMPDEKAYQVKKRNICSNAFKPAIAVV